MKNSEQPINPIEGSHQGINPKMIIGLTKREYFAGLAMQGMLANKDASDFDALTTAQIAINYAETLLDELGEL